jgi:hypothetical protein
MIGSRNFDPSSAAFALLMQRAEEAGQMRRAAD